MYLYGVPDDEESAIIAKLLSVLGGILQGTRRLELNLNEIDWFAPWDRAQTKRGGRIILKVDGFREIAKKKGFDDWEIHRLREQLELKIKSFIEGSSAYCYFT
ncbi:MAG: hypothetical protein V1845_02540 [bacterium]